MSALGWVLASDDRAQRLLTLTGLTPEILRDSLAEPAIHQAVLDFLCGHEPDLIAASEALGVDPSELAIARERLKI